MPDIPRERKIAKQAGLRYEIPGGPGVRRKKAGKGFTYVHENGRPVRDRRRLKRILSLVIPPAWTSVWISPREDAHIQAAGRDARGRKQYRYHPGYRQIKDEIKFHKLLAFGRSLPRIRAAVKRDLKVEGLPKRKILATVVSLLQTTSVRVGNDEYAKQNGSFGLTTLRNRHVKVNGSQIKFHFRGKSGVEHTIEVSDQRLARVVRSCQCIPGHELFCYKDEEGQVHSIGSGDVNEYLRELTGADITAKDFRTWNGSCLAIVNLAARARASEKTTVKAVVEAIKNVAASLGNRPATCKKFYVHPAVLDAYQSGELSKRIDSLSLLSGRLPLRYEEKVLVALLKVTAAASR